MADVACAQNFLGETDEADFASDNTENDFKSNKTTGHLSPVIAWAAL
jgi:hypothetical protein